MKLFWKKFSAVALIGAMLSNVGCTYKADIEELNRQVEALKGTVALKADVQKIQTTVDQIAAVDFSQFLKTADFAAQLKASGVVYSSDLKAWLTSDEVKALIEGYKYQTAEDVQKLIDGLQSKEDVEAVFNAMIGAYDIWGAVSGNVAEAIAEAMKNADFMTAESKLSDAQVNQVMSEIAKAFGAEGTDVKAAIDAWLGENFAKYMESYEPTDAFIAKLGIGTSAVSAILDEVKDANSEFTAEINRLIAEATNGAISEATLDSKLSAYNTRLTAVEVKVAEIEGRIQSIVWVPQTVAEVQNKAVELGARNTITVTNPKAAKDKEKVVVLSESEKTVVWEVAPKSVLAKISEENIEVYSSEVATKAGHPVWENAKVKINAEEGTIAVTLSAADQLYDDQKKETKSVIALHVSVPSAVEGGIGIDYTSDYILVDQEDGDKYEAKDFAFFKENEAPTAFGDTHEMSIIYTETGTFNFVEGASVVVTEGTAEKPVYTAIDEKWAAAFGDKLELVVTPVKVSGKEVVAVSTLSAADAKELLTLTVNGFTVKKSDAKLIGSTVTSGEFNYTIAGKKGTEYEGYSLNVGNIKVQYAFDKDEMEAAVSAAEFIWKYEKTSYTSEALTVSGLDVAGYNAIFRGVKSGKLMDYSGKKPVEIEGVKPQLSKVGAPVKDTDPMYTELRITDYSGVAFVKGGEYTAEFEVEIANSVVTLTVPVTVTGAPALTGLEIETAPFHYNGGLTYTVMKADEKTGFKAQLIKKNEHLWAKEVKEPQITEAQFAAMVDRGGQAPEDGNDVAFSDANGALTVTFTAKQVDDEKVYPVSLEYGIEGFGFEVKTEVSLVTPVVTLTPNSALVVNGRALVKSDINLGSKTFAVEDKDFKNVFEAMTNGKINPICEVVYSVVKNMTKDGKPADKQAEALVKLGDNAPEFVGNVLHWNDWAGLELTVVAKAIIGDVTVDSKEFTVYINDPVAEKIADVKDVKDDKKPENNFDHDIYAGETLDLNKYIILEAGSAKVNVFGKTDDAAAANEALEAKAPKFELVGANSLVAVEGDEITLSANAVEIVNAFDVKVKVTYSYRFGTRVHEFTLKAKPGTRPVVK